MDGGTLDEFKSRGLLEYMHIRYRRMIPHLTLGFVTACGVKCYLNQVESIRSNLWYLSSRQCDTKTRLAILREICMYGVQNIDKHECLVYWNSFNPTLQSNTRYISLLDHSSADGMDFYPRLDSQHMNHIRPRVRKKMVPKVRPPPIFVSYEKQR